LNIKEKTRKDYKREDDELLYQDWLRLMHYFDHELAEREITEETHRQMIDALMSLKPRGEEG
jgi:hypothetical protein